VSLQLSLTKILALFNSACCLLLDAKFGTSDEPAVISEQQAMAELLFFACCSKLARFVTAIAIIKGNQGEKSEVRCHNRKKREEGAKSKNQ